MLNHDYTVYSRMPFCIFCSMVVSIRMYLCDLIKPHWDYVLLLSIIIICFMLSAQPLKFNKFKEIEEFTSLLVESESNQKS